MVHQPRVKCPFCGTTKVDAIGLAGDMFLCNRCGSHFDNDPEEGGDYSTSNPAARLEREERRPGRTNRRRK